MTDTADLQRYFKDSEEALDFICDGCPDEGGWVEMNYKQYCWLMFVLFQILAQLARLNGLWSIELAALILSGLFGFTLTGVYASDFSAASKDRPRE